MIFNDKTEAKEYIDNLNCAKIEVKAIRKNRSLNQNAYFYGVVCSVFGLEFGCTAEESKQIFAQKFLPYKHKGVSFVKSTKDLDTKEFEEFCEKCRKFASENGCFIPLPNEVGDVLLNSIEANKKWL
jgi:hypothetical protein